MTEHKTGFTSTLRDAVLIAVKTVKYNWSCTQEVLKRGNGALRGGMRCDAFVTCIDGEQDYFVLL